MPFLAQKMPDHFDDIDLKTPRPYENVAPPSYTDAIRADTVTNPTPYSNTNYSAPNNEYSTPNPIGFDILHQQRPQPNHEPNYNYGQSYPPGTGGYPGAGMYNSSSPTSPQPTSYVIRRIGKWDYSLNFCCGGT